MNVGPAAASGHICQARSAALTAVPMGISPFATSTSTVSSWATGLGGSGAFVAAGEQGSEAAGNDGDTENNDTRGFHTLELSR